MSLKALQQKTKGASMQHPTMQHKPAVKQEQNPFACTGSPLSAENAAALIERLQKPIAT